MSDVLSHDKLLRARELNDVLRTTFKGGRIEVHHGDFHVDDRTIGRMLCVLARYEKFEEGSAHDHGVFVFAGFAFEFFIEEHDNERVLTIEVTRDVLHFGR